MILSPPPQTQRFAWSGTVDGIGSFAWRGTNPKNHRVVEHIRRAFCFWFVFVLIFYSLLGIWILQLSSFYSQNTEITTSFLLLKLACLASIVISFWWWGSYLPYIIYLTLQPRVYYHPQVFIQSPFYLFHWNA